MVASRPPRSIMSLISKACNLLTSVSLRSVPSGSDELNLNSPSNPISRRISSATSRIESSIPIALLVSVFRTLALPSGGWYHSNPCSMMSSRSVGHLLIRQKLMKRLAQFPAVHLAGRITCLSIRREYLRLGNLRCPLPDECPYPYARPPNLLYAGISPDGSYGSWLATHARSPD